MFAQHGLTLYNGAFSRSRMCVLLRRVRNPVQSDIFPHASPFSGATALDRRHKQMEQMAEKVNSTLLKVRLAFA